MSLDRWPESRFRMERRHEDGFYLRHLEPAAGVEARGTLFYVHGLGESGLCYEGIICDPRLADWRHVAPDLLGYGRSLWPDRPLSVEDHVAELQKLLDRLPPGPVVVVGHSMGGVIGLEMADRNPDRVRFFVNVEGNVTYADCGFSGIAAGFGDEQWLAGGYGHFVERVQDLAGDGEDSDSPEVVRAYGASVHFADPRTLHRNAVDLVTVSKTETLAGRYGASTVPTVYLHGHPRGTGERSLRQLHEAGVATRGFEPAGHWPFLDQHDAFTDALAEILEKV